ncbi:hypothetical protein ACCO45_004739 [Purpureocillium lilacinum]|uniref:Uncharacterized protein n=1 Tax=Purpureocillium lilacinum TaxID=33203 RepID=A0ACC4DU48_PURLI
MPQPRAIPVDGPGWRDGEATNKTRSLATRRTRDKDDSASAPSNHDPMFCCARAACVDTNGDAPTTQPNPTRETPHQPTRRATKVEQSAEVVPALLFTILPSSLICESRVRGARGMSSSRPPRQQHDNGGYSSLVTLALGKLYDVPPSTGQSVRIPGRFSKSARPTSIAPAQPTL